MSTSDITTRQRDILNAIKANSDISVSQISEMIKVAPATIRRDLTKLSQLQYIEKSYGKLSLVNPAAKRIKESSDLLNEEQISLIKATVKQIHSGNVILLNYSPINCRIVDQLLIEGKSATIVTNSLSIFDRTKDSSSINNILLAGLYNKETETFSGTTTYSILSTIRADCFVMHPSGIDFQIGFLAKPTEDLTLLQYMINVARKVILYIDESCIKKTSGLLVSGFNTVNIVVVTRKIYEEYKQELEVYDFSIIIAD